MSEILLDLEIEVALDEAFPEEILLREEDVIPTASLFAARDLTPRLDDDDAPMGILASPEEVFEIMPRAGRQCGW